MLAGTSSSILGNECLQELTLRREKMPEPNYSPEAITIKHYRGMSDL
jgi:hypothetical protein